jgi:branched-chain amino acid transport system permease protein
MDGFLDELARGAVTGSVYGLIVLPFIFLWRSTRVFSLVQSQISIGIGLMVIRYGFNPVVGLLVVVLGIAAGLVTYGTAVVPVRRRGDTSHGTLVSTLALGLLFQAILIAVFGSVATIGTTPFSSLRFTLFTGTIYTYYSCALVVVCVLAGAVTSVALNRSDLGIQWRAMGDSRSLAGARGVRVVRMEAICFMVGGLGSAVVGLLVASQVPLEADNGLNFALDAFLVMGFAGLERPLAGAIGGIVLGMAETVMLAYWNAGIVNVVLVGALMAWLLVRGGVRGQTVREF